MVPAPADEPDPHQPLPEASPASPVLGYAAPAEARPALSLARWPLAQIARGLVGLMVAVGLGTLGTVAAAWRSDLPVGVVLLLGAVIVQAVATWMVTPSVAGAWIVNESLRKLARTLATVSAAGVVAIVPDVATGYRGSTVMLPVMVTAAVFSGGAALVALARHLGHTAVAFGLPDWEAAAVFVSRTLWLAPLLGAVSVMIIPPSIACAAVIVGLFGVACFVTYVCLLARLLTAAQRHRRWRVAYGE
jgi:hypothetical protein